tara:strand:- start:38 stop:838 length:801 start_codon:yes stop_codon:yes gene_type:complete
MMNTVNLESCITGMQKLAADSVDIVICDPPYNIGKDFGNTSDKQTMKDYLAFCEEWIAEGKRILKPKGTMYIYGFAKILMHLGCMVELTFDLNVEWLQWHYTNKTAPGAKFWQKSHESILVCSKDKRPTFNRDDIRVPYEKGTIRNGGKKRAATSGRMGKKETVYTNHPGGALPRDVIKVPALSGGAGRKERLECEDGSKHPTQKPLALCTTLIKACKLKGEPTLVVIPFAGSGAECLACHQMEDVNYIGYEINPMYVELCTRKVV